MKRASAYLGSVVCVLVLSGLASPALGQEKKPGRAIVSLYNVAPGKHLDFLKWMAAQEAVGKEAGAPAGVWYAHTDGASWDYMLIQPQVDAAKQDELDKKMDAISKQKGRATGFKSSLEFRQYISNHSDTFAMGGMTAADLVKAAEKKD